MTLEYDKRTDSLAINFTETEVEETDEIKPGVIVDFDSDGTLVSIEILNASKKISKLDQIVYNSKLMKAA